MRVTRAKNFREMIMVDLRRVVVAFMLVAFASTAVAQDHPGRGGGDRPNRQEQGQQGGTPREQGGPGVLSLLPADAVSEHSIDTPNGKLAYTATAGTIPAIRPIGRARSAAVFYTAYVAKTSADKNDNHAARPLTFVFNGGPGAASAFLHLGWRVLRIAQFGMSGHDGANVRLVDNPGTLARLHRSGADRSDRHRLEPGGQAGRRQRVLGRAQRRRVGWRR